MMMMMMVDLHKLHAVVQRSFTVEEQQEVFFFW